MCTIIFYLMTNAPILTFAINQSHIDTVAMLPKHFFKMAAATAADRHSLSHIPSGLCV